jgi:hypothetical protein
MVPVATGCGKPTAMSEYSVSSTSSAPSASSSQQGWRQQISCNSSKRKKNEPASSVEAPHKNLCTSSVRDETSTSKPLQMDEFETFVDRPKKFMGPLTFQRFNELWSIAENHIVRHFLQLLPFGCSRY